MSRRRKSAPAAEQPLQARLDALFRSAAQAHAPGLMVGVAHGGRTLYRKGFGLASLEHAVAITPATRFRIASVSKQFTSLAALLLAADGALDVDAPAVRWLPELAAVAQGERVTLRQMMNHTSGLRDASDLQFTASGLTPVPSGLELRLLARQRRLNFEPGTCQLYCNSGYWLLALAVERAAGLPFERVLRERVCLPLGLRDTESVPSDYDIVPGLATMHQALPDGRWRRGCSPLEDQRGAGAMVSTVDDLLRWAAHLRAATPGAVPAQAWQQLVEPATLAHGHRSEYALGIVANHYRGVPVLQHGGSLPGVATQFITVPSHALDVVVLANCEIHDVVGLSKQVIDAVLGDALGAPPAPYVASAGFGHLMGQRWRGDSGMVVGFDEVGGRLGFSFLHSPPIPLLEHRGSQIGLGGGGTGPFCFDTEALQADDGGGPPAQLTLYDAGLPQTLHRMSPARPAPAEVAPSWTGHYRCDELGADARIELEPAGTLALHLDTPQALRSATLEPLAVDVLGVLVRDPVFPARYVLTRRGADAFDLDGGRNRHLRFERAASA